LKTLVRTLKQRNDTLTSENKLMERTIGDLKTGKYSFAESVKTLSSDEVQRLKN
jgi:hypothetical protein